MLTRPGSQDLQELFSRTSEAPLANDTSIGVGYAPMSALETLVLDVERHINGRDRIRVHPAWGEDVKVMGVRQVKSVRLTVACSMIGRYLAHSDDYFAETSELRTLVAELARQPGFTESEVDVNAADGASQGALYLTVTGTSAKAGDDGQVGRGNRRGARDHAWSLLSKHFDWWEPGGLKPDMPPVSDHSPPHVFYRILVEHVSGREAKE